MGKRVYSDHQLNPARQIMAEHGATEAAHRTGVQRKYLYWCVKHRGWTVGKWPWTSAMVQQIPAQRLCQEYRCRCGLVTTWRPCPYCGEQAASRGRVA